MGSSVLVACLLACLVVIFCIAAPAVPAGAAASTSTAAGPITIDTSSSALANATLAATQRYIIEFTEGTTSTAEATAHAQRGMAVQNILSNVFPGEVIDLTASQVKSLRLNPRVLSIEADTPVSAETMQSPATWGLDRIDQPQLPLSNSYSYDRTGAGVKAYVVDSGILASHTDFGGRVSNGFSYYGKSQFEEGGKCSTPKASKEVPAYSTDEDGHGTHVAGILGGTTYGVAKGVTLIPVRVLDCKGGGFASSIVAGLDFVVRDHVAGTPAVANLSIGMSVSDDVDKAVNATIADGVTVAVAAGNSNKDACNSSPSRVPNALTVAAIDSADTRASWSNYGSCVDLFAPGVSITSDYKDGKTVLMSGTSMATPHVAGAAALLLEATPTATPAQISSALIAQSVPDVVRDGGSNSPNRLLNTGATQAPITERPAAPTSVTATTPAAGSTTVTWTRSTSVPILDQTVNIYRNATLLKPTVVSSDVTSMNYTSMTAGASYTFSVQARNAAGLSAESSPSSPVVYRTAPSAPAVPVASLTAGGAGSITWALGSDNGSALTEQIVRTYRGTSLVATTSVSGTDTSFTTPSMLDVGTAYKFTVQARNSLGLSTESAFSNTVTRIVAPSAATNVAAAVKSTSNVKVTWTIGSNGGSALRGQIVNLYKNGVFVASYNVGASEKSLVLEGMKLGETYTFTVQSRNNIGWSPESVLSNAVKRTR